MLVQPTVLCGFLLALWILPIVPIAPQLAVCAGWMLTFRWVLVDQRRRCPVCLRLLGTPVRMAPLRKHCWSGTARSSYAGGGMACCTARRR